MTKKILNGQETSVIAFLAQYPNISKTEQDKLLAPLKGEALKIATVVVGRYKNPSRKYQKIRASLQEWAEENNKMIRSSLSWRNSNTRHTG